MPPAISRGMASGIGAATAPGLLSVAIALAGSACLALALERLESRERWRCAPLRVRRVVDDAFRQSREDARPPSPRLPVS